MKKLICGLALAIGLSLSCHAQGMKISAYPNTNNLAGTNLFLIAIVGSPGTNMNISYAQLSNLLAAAIGGGGGGAQVWTNPNSVVQFTTTNNSLTMSFSKLYDPTNIAMTLDVTSDWEINPNSSAYDGGQLMSLQIGGTNKAYFNRFGGLVIGQYSTNYDGAWVGADADKNMGLLIYRNVEAGEPSHVETVLFEWDDINSQSLVQSEVDTGYSQQVVGVRSLGTNDAISIIGSGRGDCEFIAQTGNYFIWDMEGKGSAYNYMFNTVNSVGDTNRIVMFKNHGTNKLHLTGQGVVVFPSNTLATIPVLNMGEYGIGQSNGYGLWAWWNTNGTTAGKQLAP